MNSHRYAATESVGRKDGRASQCVCCECAAVRADGAFSTIQAEDWRWFGCRERSTSCGCSCGRLECASGEPPASSKSLLSHKNRVMVSPQNVAPVAYSLQPQACRSSSGTAQQRRAYSKLSENLGLSHQAWLQGGLVGSAGSGLKMKDWDKALADSDEEEQDRAGGSGDGSSDDDDDEADE